MCVSRLQTLLPFLLLGTGCGFLSEADLDARIDQDGDGYAAEQFGGNDCDDGNRDIWPGAIEVCDGIDNNCDGDADGDALDKRTWYRDADEDGYGSPSSEDPAVSCFPPDGFVGDASDCNDDPTNNGASIHPRTIWYKDLDGDGYGNPEDSVVTCIQLLGLVSDDTDCDDEDPELHPGTVWWEDNDGDGHGTSAAAVTACWLEDEIPDGYVRAGSSQADCNDDDPGIYPDAQELWYDEVLNDCSGELNTRAMGSEDAVMTGRSPGEFLGKAIRGIGYFFACDPQSVHMSDCVDEGQLPDIAVSAPSEYTNGPSSGAVYLLDSDETDDRLRTTLLGSSAINRLGRYLTAPGDLNQDGFDDLIIGSQDDYAFVIFGGNARDTVATMSTHHKSEQIAVYVAEDEGDELGASGVGLMNFCGDGGPDLALGAPQSATLGDGSGYVYIFLDAGRNSTINIAEMRMGVDTAPPEDVEEDEFGGSSSHGTGTGDTGMDTTDDTDGTDGTTEETTDIPEAWEVAPESDGLGALFGQTLASLGDFDGDGMSDLLIGAPSGDWGETDAGRIYLLTADDFAMDDEGDTGGPDVSDELPTFGFTRKIYADDLMRIDGKFEGDRLGQTIAPAGDFNGDGYQDFVVAATGITSSPRPGRVYIVLGEAKGIGEDTSEVPYKIDDMADVFIEPDITLGEGNFGLSIAPAGPLRNLTESRTPGDLDGDGISDLLIGSPDVDTPAYAAGRVYLVYGGILGTWDIEDLLLPSELSEEGIDGGSGYTRVGAMFTGHAGYNLGFAVDGPGDIDGDGFADLLLGAPGADVLGSGTGTGALFFLSGVDG